MDQRERLTGAVADFLHQRGRSINNVSDDTALFTSGMLDSIDVLHLVVVLENTFGIAISPLDVSLDQLDSIGRIRTFIVGRLDARD